MRIKCLKLQHCVILKSQYARNLGIHVWMIKVYSNKKYNVRNQNLHFYRLQLPIFKQFNCRRRSTNWNGRLKSFKYELKNDLFFTISLDYKAFTRNSCQSCVFSYRAWKTKVCMMAETACHHWQTKTPSLAKISPANGCQQEGRSLRWKCFTNSGVAIVWAARGGPWIWRPRSPQNTYCTVTGS